MPGCAGVPPGGPGGTPWRFFSFFAHRTEVSRQREWLRNDSVVENNSGA